MLGNERALMVQLGGSRLKAWLPHRKIFESAEERVSDRKVGWFQRMTKVDLPLHPVSFKTVYALIHQFARESKDRVQQAALKQ